MKTELVHPYDFKTLKEARTTVFENIEVFYNPQSLHSANGQEALLVFEKMQETA